LNMAVTVDIPDGLISFLIVVAVIVAITGILAGVAFAVITVQKKKRREQWSSIPKDVVLLHQLPRGKYSPNLSPFALKVETYLRMAKIPYHVDFDEPYGPTGKCPWITLNGEDICDSHVIIERLGKHFNKDFSSKLTLLEKAEGRAFQVMMEEHFFWVLPLWHSMLTKFTQFDAVLELPWYQSFLLKLVKKRQFKRRVDEHGIGKLKPNEAKDLLEVDLRSLSYFLNSKKFLFGDEPTEYDCGVFGMLIQALWCMPGSQYQSLLYGELSNLREYCLRMKQKFWLDWNKCLNPPVIEEKV